METWRFYDEGQNLITALAPRAPTYDPRERGWYKEAGAAPEQLVHTAPYVFAAAARTGMTIARAFGSGVVAVDVTLGRLSLLLNQARSTPGHRIVLFDADGNVLAAPDASRIPTTKTLMVTDVDDSAVAAVAARWRSEGAFEVQEIVVDGEPYLASVTPLPDPTGQRETAYILNAAPRADFEGSLTGAAGRSILSALFVTLLASPAIVYFARMVSRPIVALADNARLIEAIIDTIPNPVFYKDADAAYLGCNKAYEKHFGVRRQDLVGTKLSEASHLPEEVRRRYQAEDLEVIETGSPRRQEITATFSDGQQHEVLHYLNGFRRNDGSPGGLVGTIVDITELKQAQRAMTKAKEIAEAATRAKGEFLASMSHEIRTPLNGITGMAELLAQSSLNDDQKHMLQTIRESGNSLMRIINDILDFSKIEAGKLTIETIPMSIADALEGVAITLAPGASGKGVNIHAFVDPAIPPSLIGDPVRLRQILFNLLGNAIKFSEKRDVAARALLLSDASGVCRVRFEIVDQGIGISEENQGRLFQAFSQAESSTTRRFGGTGLGLAICKRLTTLMDGALGVASTFGHGSTFWVELPFATAQESRSRESLRDLAGLNVLLAGCPSPRREAISAYLSHWGAQPVATSDVADTIAAIARAAPSFDCVIVDFDFDKARHADFTARLADARVPLITLRDSRQRGARISGENLVNVDANPLVRHRIISAVAVAVGRASPDIKHEDEEGSAEVQPPSIAEAQLRGQLVLVAEDNATNQDVIRRQLNRLGYACEIAGNGVEALKAWTSGRYAIVLTDCHMPEMDGYELTANIRKLEQDSGRRIPILAITANVLQAEIERCFAAGMDDCLSKPIAMRALREALRKWAPGTDIASAQVSPIPAAKAKTPATDVPVDDRAIKDMFGDDAAMFKEILVSFIAPSRQIMTQITAGVSARDAATIKDCAHQLKSSARTIGAIVLADLCVDLEAAGAVEDWRTIATLAPQAAVQMDRVLTYINDL
jgi:two-component system sensor histidine kinase/response regulator